MALIYVDAAYALAVHAYPTHRRAAFQTYAAHLLLCQGMISRVMALAKGQSAYCPR